jgi:hypothetical protein
MDINWSALDGVLGVALVVVIIWAALNLMKRIVLALIVLVIIAVAFFGVHFGDFGFGGA